MSIAAMVQQAQALEDFAETEFPLDVSDAPWSPIEWLPFAVVVVLTFVVLPWAVKRLRRSGEEVEPLIEVVMPTPREQMALRLAALNQLPLDNPEQRQWVFEEGADALRNYLVEQWQFPAHQQTSQESLQAWRQSQLSDDALQLLFELCDRSKFAAHNNSQADVKLWLQRCEEFMEVGL